MGELVFYQSCMGAGKSLQLLIQAYRLEELNNSVELYKPEFDTRTHTTIKSRIELERKCKILKNDEYLSNCFDWERVDFVLIDEAQFLTVEQVRDIASFVDYEYVSVYCYGLKLNHHGDFFPASRELLLLSDRIETIAKKCKYNPAINANFHIKKNGDPNATAEVGGDDMYEAVCRKIWFENLNDIEEEFPF